MISEARLVEIVEADLKMGHYKGRKKNATGNSSRGTKRGRPNN
jgi:hypothetical protein